MMGNFKILANALLGGGGNLYFKLDIMLLK